MKWPKVARTTHDSIVKPEVTRTIFTIPILLVSAFHEESAMPALPT